MGSKSFDTNEWFHKKKRKEKKNLLQVDEARTKKFCSYNNQFDLVLYQLNESNFARIALNIYLFD